jgi:hypothetical protein
MTGPTDDWPDSGLDRADLFWMHLIAWVIVPLLAVIAVWASR